MSAVERRITTGVDGGEAVVAGGFMALGALGVAKAAGAASAGTAVGAATGAAAALVAPVVGVATMALGVIAGIWRTITSGADLFDTVLETKRWTNLGHQIPLFFHYLASIPTFAAIGLANLAEAVGSAAPVLGTAAGVVAPAIAPLGIGMGSLLAVAGAVLTGRSFALRRTLDNHLVEQQAGNDQTQAVVDLVKAGHVGFSPSLTKVVNESVAYGSYIRDDQKVELIDLAKADNARQLKKYLIITAVALGMIAAFALMIAFPPGILAVAMVSSVLFIALGATFIYLNPFAQNDEKYEAELRQKLEGMLKSPEERLAVAQAAAAAADAAANEAYRQHAAPVDQVLSEAGPCAQKQIAERVALEEERGRFFSELRMRRDLGEAERAAAERSARRTFAQRARDLEARQQTRYLDASRESERVMKTQVMPVRRAALAAQERLTSARAAVCAAEEVARVAREMHAPVLAAEVALRGARQLAGQANGRRHEALQILRAHPTNAVACDFYQKLDAQYTGEWEPYLRQLESQLAAARAEERRRIARMQGFGAAPAQTPAQAVAIPVLPATLAKPPGLPALPAVAGQPVAAQAASAA